MSIHTAVAEGALTLAFIKQPTRYLPECGLVLLDELILVAAHAMIVRRNHQVARLTADGASTIVVLGRALVVGGSP